MGYLSLLGAGSADVPMPLDMKLWLDAAQGVDSVGGYVRGWNDVSGNGNHLTQSNGSYQPTIEAGVKNGLPAVYFNLSYMNFSGFNCGLDISFFVVFSQPVAHNNCFIFPNQSVLEDKYISQASNNFLVTNSYVSNVLDSDVWTVMTAIKGNDPSLIYRNSVYIGSTAGRNDNTTYAYVGTVPGAVAIFRICEMIIYNRKLGNGERGAVEKFLNKKYLVF